MIRRGYAAPQYFNRPVSPFKSSFHVLLGSSMGLAQGMTLLIQVIRRRLEVYRREASPVEDFFREQGVLLDYEITAGIPETLPHLLSTLKPFTGNWEMAEVDL